MDNRHGEPWRATNTEKLKFGFTATHVTCDNEDVGVFHQDFLAERAVLCVNACAGMSDEKVEELCQLQDRFNNQAEIISRWYDEHSAYITLKAQLDEAVELLVWLKGSLSLADDTVGGRHIKEVLDKHRSSQ